MNQIHFDELAPPYIYVNVLCGTKAGIVGLILQVQDPIQMENETVSTGSYIYHETQAPEESEVSGFRLTDSTLDGIKEKIRRRWNL